MEPLEPRRLLAGDPLITEVMAINRHTFLDIDGLASDWFEVHNPTSEPISLLGYSVTDDPALPDKWQFSDVTLEAGDYLVVFASEKDRSGGNTHFRLTRDFHSTPDGTFLVDLPEGTYEVGITAGDTRARDEVVLHIQGTVVDTLNSQADEFLEKTYTANVDAATGGQLSIRLEDTGGQTGRGVINGLVITATDGSHEVRFDFGGPETFDHTVPGLMSPVEPGYTPVLKTDTYSPAVGYGWQAGTVIGEVDRGGVDGDPHTNFKLSSRGDYLALVSPAGMILSEYGPNGRDFPQQHTDVSYGIVGNTPGSEMHYFVDPTPGAANSAESIAIGFVDDTTFSVNRGFYDAPFDLEITTSTAGASIVFTTDGTEPNLQNGVVVSAPDPETPPTATIPIDKTTILRAMALKANYVPTNIDAQTYLFVDDIIQQTYQATLNAGFPRTYRDANPGTSVDPTADYGMDPDVIGQNGQDRFGGLYADTIRDDLKSAATISLVMDLDDMFGLQGIYTNPEDKGQAWERPVSLEFIDPATGDDFQVEAGIRIQGAAARTLKQPKHPFRLFFKDLYGAPKLEFPLFGEGATDRFDTFTMRPNVGDSWINSGSRGHNTRDAFVSRSQLAMGQPSSHERFVHVYINGFYWGLYDARERPDDSFAESYLGGEKEQWDVLKETRGVGTEANQGTLDAWNTLRAIVKEVKDANDEAVRTAGFLRTQGKHPDGSNNPEWEDYLDVDNYIDYLITNIFAGNLDWPHNNYYMARLRGPESTGFKFFCWDAETSLGIRLSGTVDRISSIISDVGEIFFKLRGSEEFRLQFADRVHQHFFNDGALIREANFARFEKLVEEIDRAIVAESARWGDVRSNQPLTRAHWLAEGDRIRNNFLDQRTETLVRHFRDADLYPDIDAPEFEINGLHQHGGSIIAGADLTIRDEGQDNVTSYYTLNGKDPREIGGAVSASALMFQPGVDPAIALNETTQVKARILDGSGQWSALSEAVFAVAVSELRITELNYNPYDPTPAEVTAGFTNNDDFEFIELENVGPTTINLLGTRFSDGIEFTFPSMLLDAGERVVVVKNQDAFETRYGMGIHIAGEFTTSSLSNAGENLTLVGPDNITTILDFAYNDNDPWPERADGNGGTLELIDPIATPAEESGKYYHWRGSTEFGGSPGAAGSEPLGVVINEVLSNTDTPSPSDSIELYNPTVSTLDIGGLYLSDSAANFLKYQIPIGTMLGAGEYIVFDESDFNPSDGTDPNDFGLSGTRGDEVWLTVPDGSGGIASFVDDVHFGAAASGESFGRTPDGSGRLAPMTGLTLDAANSAPRVGPLVVSEMNYNPARAPVFFQQDFNDGTAEGFTPLSGTWTVTDGRYEVTPVAQDDGVTTIPGLTALPTHFRIDATVFIPADADSSKNGAMIFDYQGPTDFKFASFHAGSGRWRIGHRDANAWNFLAELQQTFASDTNHAVTVQITGTVARVLSGGVEKVRYDFGTPLNGGLVGLGSKNGQAFFDDVTVGLIDFGDTEFVELFNPTGSAVDLTDWQIRGGVDFNFDPGTMIGAGDTVVVISFNPDAVANADRVAAFRAHYGIDGSVPLVGGFAGSLNNNGEKIQLQRPDAPPPGEPLFIPRLLEDEVIYDDLAPWPTEADGAGKSLTRMTIRAYGNLVTSWTAVDPTPGSASFNKLGDMDLDDDVDCDDIDGFVLGLSDPAAYEILYGVPATLHGDTDHDGDLDFDDIDDLLLLLSCGGGPQAGSAMNADGQVNDGDVVQPTFGLNVVSYEPTNGLHATIHGDADRDGDIDFDDIDDFLVSLNAHANVTDTLHVASASSASSATSSTRSESPTHDSVWSDPTDWLTRIIHEATTLARSAS